MSWNSVSWTPDWPFLWGSKSRVNFFSFDDREVRERKGKFLKLCLLGGIHACMHSFIHSFHSQHNSSPAPGGDRTPRGKGHGERTALWAAALSRLGDVAGVRAAGSRTLGMCRCGPLSCSLASCCGACVQGPSADEGWSWARQGLWPGDLTQGSHLPLMYVRGHWGSPKTPSQCVPPPLPRAVMELGDCPSRGARTS